jgi:ABC-type Mn2+/Zn2+ transport system ATPase subunit
VLNRLSFDVEKGSIAAVIGPNGSGKTTLFKALLDLIPYEGHVRVFQKPIREVLHRIGYVPQYFDFDRTLPITVKEFLNFVSPRRDRQSEEICKEVRVDALMGKLIGELSGGQLQRVLIAQALMKNPDLMLLDEPSAGIDIEGAKAFYDLIRHVNQEHGVTVLLISHEVSMVYNLADQILCLNRDLVCDGPPRQALTKEVMEKLYGPEVGLRGHQHL